MKIGQFCQRQHCKHVKLEQFFGRLSRRAGLSAIAGLSCLKCHVKKNVINIESVVQVFTFLHFEIPNEHFHCKTITHVMLYIQYYIKTVHFWLKYNGLATVRRTTKLIDGGHRGLQDYRHICYYFCVFLTFLRLTENLKSR